MNGDKSASASIRFYSRHSLAFIPVSRISQMGALRRLRDQRVGSLSRVQEAVVPDSFTHGTSQQRVRWFRRGYETGDLSEGDTFSARDL